MTVSAFSTSAFQAPPFSTSRIPKSEDKHAFIFVDLQHYFLNQVSHTPEQRQFFKSLTDKCVSVSQSVKDHVPAVHVFTDIDLYKHYTPALAACKAESYRREYQDVRQRVYYDSKYHSVHQNPEEVRGLRSGVYLESLYPVTESDSVVFKTGHSGFGPAGRDALRCLLQEKHITNCVLMGAFADNCVYATADDALARGYKVTVLSDCTASRDSSFDKQDLITENKKLFAPLKSVSCITSDEFVRSIKNGQR
jgi:nicotinamidase-related amidase